MDAIRKKMKSIKDETDQLYAIISKFENATKEAESISKEVSFISEKNKAKKKHSFHISTISVTSTNSQITIHRDQKLSRLTVASATTARRCMPLRWSWRRPLTS